MKNNKKNLFVLAALILTLASNSFAAESNTTPSKKSHKHSAAPATAPVSSEHTKSALEASSVSSSAPKRFGLGLQTLNGSVGGSMAAVSGLIEIDSLTNIQAFATIGSTSPFQFGVGGAARRTVSGNEHAGFHVGGLIALGTLAAGSTTTISSSGKVSSSASTKFFINFTALGGVHFQIPGVEKVLVSFDGGPNLAIFDGNTNFSIDALSPFLGFNIHYFLN